MPTDVPPSGSDAVEFVIVKSEDGTITDFSDLKKYPELDFISEQDARGLLEWFRAFYGFLVTAYQTWQVVDLSQATYLRDTYNDLAAAYTHVANFISGEKTKLVPINQVPDSIDAIRRAFENVWTQNNT